MCNGDEVRICRCVEVVRGVGGVDEKLDKFGGLRKVYGGVEASFYVLHSDRVAAAERPPRPVRLTQKL